MHDRTHYSNAEAPPTPHDDRRHDHPQRVKKYLDLADTALDQKQDGQDRRPAA